MLEAVRLLIVGDSEDEALRIVREFERAGFDPVFEQVGSAAALKAAVEVNGWDAIISDHSLAGFDSEAAVEVLRETGRDLPFISVCDVAGEGKAVELLKAGVHDCVAKGHLDRLVPAVRREMRAAEGRRVRRESEAASRHLAAIVESCEDAVIGESLTGIVQSWNAAAERLHGYTAGEMIGRSIFTLIPPYRPEDLTAIYDRIKRGERVERLETVRIRKDGTPVEVSLTVSPVKDGSGLVVGVSTIARDITAPKQEENERLNLIQELTAALARARNVQPPRTICPACRKILNEQGRWQPLEGYLEEHSKEGCAQGLGPACTVRLAERAA